MKYAFLTAIFLTAVSCGKYEAVGTGSIGEALTDGGASLNPQVLSTICSALSNKSASQLANSTHTFATVQTDCNGGNVVAGALVPTVIQGSGGNFYFKRQDNGMDFLFPEVDTTSFGVMSSICSSLANQQQLTSLNTLSNGDTQKVITSGISSSDCAPTSNELCVYFETGSPNGAGSVIVHTKEWVRYKVNPQEAKVGFYSYRKKITKSYCSQNQFVTSQATLK